MEEQKVNGGWSKASIVLGVIAMIFALLPLVSAWFMFLTFLNYFMVPIGVICGIVAIVKRQNLKKSIIGIVLCVLAIVMPFILAEYYLASAAESAGNMLDAFGAMQ